MRGIGLALAAMAGSVLASPIWADEAPIPSGIAWAYPQGKSKMPFPAIPTDKTIHVEGSPLSFTGRQLKDMSDPVDWLPNEHPALPKVVAHSDHKRQLEACGACHGLAGQGVIETPNLAGLPAGYIAEQVREFAAGRRHSSMANRGSVLMMADTAAKLSEAEIAEAAAYFSSIARRAPLVRVVETDQAPRTRAHFFGWQELVAGGGEESIGRRVVEVAEDFDQMVAGDPHAGMVAYVPKGSIDRGKSLAHQGTQPCISCHGADLEGMGDVPPLAGRDPHYLARALWDIKTGARGGPAVALMQKPAAGLTEDQILDLVAYLASLTPWGSRR